MTKNLTDPDLELALVAEALRRYDRFQTHGLSDADFESPKSRAVIRALAACWEAGEGTGLDAVARTLQRTGDLDKLGGQRGLAELAVGPGAVPDAQRLRELRRLRKLRDGALEAARLAGEGNFAAATAALMDAQQEAMHATNGQTKTAGDLGRAVFEGIRDRAKGRRVDPGLPGIRRHIGEFPVGSMTLVGGDSNVGKSSFILEMLFAAMRSAPVGLVSVEDPDEVTGARLLSAVSGVSSRHVARNNLTPDSMRELARGAEELDALGSRFLFEDCTGGNDVDVRAAMSRMAARGVKLVVVDYIQEIEPSKPQQDRRNDVRWISKQLKAHARRCGMALVLVTQLSRPSDKATGKRPTKHMIKESGDVTNQAENILLLWREQESDTSPVMVFAAKIKTGGVGAEWRMQRLESAAGRLVEIDDGY